MTRDERVAYVRMSIINSELSDDEARQANERGWTPDDMEGEETFRLSDLDLEMAIEGARHIDPEE